MDFKHAGKRSFRVCIEKKKKGRQVDFSKQAGCHTTSYKSVATPRRSETRQRIAEHFHWLTVITCLSRNTRCYSQVFHHCDFSGHGRFFLKGSVHTILFYSIRVTIWSHRVAASQPRGGVAINWGVKRLIKFNFKKMFSKRQNTIFTLSFWMDRPEQTV